MMKADIVVFCVIVLCCKVQVACLGTIISGHEYKIGKIFLSYFNLLELGGMIEAQLQYRLELST